MLAKAEHSGQLFPISPNIPLDEDLGIVMEIRDRKNRLVLALRLQHVNDRCFPILDAWKALTLGRVASHGSVTGERVR